MDSVDNGIFIHAIVPRHVETVALLSRKIVNDKNVEHACGYYELENTNI